MARINDFGLACGRCELDFLAGQQFSVANQPLHFVCLEKTANATGQLPNDARAPLLHSGDIKLDCADHDAVLLELMLRTME